MQFSDVQIEVSSIRELIEKADLYARLYNLEYSAVHVYIKGTFQIGGGRAFTSDSFIRAYNLRRDYFDIRLIGQSPIAAFIIGRANALLCVE